MHLLYSAMIYFATGTVISTALIEPTADHFVAAMLACVAAYSTFHNAPMHHALAAARKQLADQNALLRAMHEAMTSDSVEPLRKYWHARK